MGLGKTAQLAALVTLNHPECVVDCNTNRIMVVTLAFVAGLSCRGAWRLG
jgi:hypothetical protein